MLTCRDAEKPRRFSETSVNLRRNWASFQACVKAMSQGDRIFEYTCVCCGVFRRGTPAFGYDMPIEVLDIPEDDRAKRVWLDPDICVIDDRLFFVRGLLDIPIHGVVEPLSWGLWVTQTEDEVNAYEDTRGTDRTGVVTKGQVTVTMPGYLDPDQTRPNSRLGCELLGRDRGLRPLIRLIPTDHALYRDHAFGISWDRAIELVSKVPHH